MKKLLAGLGAFALMAILPAFGWAQEAAEAVTEVATAATAPATIDAGNTAWILTSSALVMLMTPGLAFFYAGMVSRKNVVSTLLQNFAALALVGVLWVVIGYSLVFTEGNSFIGDASLFMLRGQTTEIYTAASIPMLAFVAFQMMFAIITPALITGSFAERVRFGPWLAIMGLWSLAVYAPVAHWVWGGGFLADMGALDFAGGLVVHITAGCSGLVAAFMYGKRTTKAQGSSTPNDVPMIMLGAALLWFGWFGFNAGSALTSGALAAHAFVTTFLGAACAYLAWTAIDWFRDSKPTAVGGACGIVSGLVAITPAAGFVDLGAACVIGLAAGLLCNVIAHYLKRISHLDDALDVFACHGIGGIVGAVLTGVFATSAVNSAVTVQGLAISGETALFFANIQSVLIVAAYSCVVTFVIIQAVKMLTPVRASADEETKGLDITLHGEKAKHNDRSHDTPASLHSVSTGGSDKAA